MTIYQRPIGKSISWIRFGLHNDTGRYTLMINRRSMQQIIIAHYPKQLKQKLPDDWDQTYVHSRPTSEL